MPMPAVNNRTAKSVVAPDYLLCATLWRKATGLMFTSSMKKPLLFIFMKERRWGLHMLFVFYPIDVLFLDKGKRVADIKENFRPFTFCTPKKPCLYIIEVPVGTIRKSKTSIGDVLKF